MKSLVLKLFPYLRKEASVQGAVPELVESAPSASLFTMAQSIADHLVITVEGITVEIGERPGGHKLIVNGSIKAKVDLIFQSLTADILEVSVNPAVQRQGRCRYFVQQLHNAIEVIGFEKMTLYAATDGRVAWAGLGFRPTPLAWHLRKNTFAAKFHSVRQKYPPDTAMLIDDLIIADDVDVFPILANIKIYWDDRLPKRELSAMILCGLEGWHGEFNVGDERYRQYLFRE